MTDDTQPAAQTRTERLHERLLDRMWLCLCLYGVLVIPLVLWREAVLGGGLERLVAPLALSLFTIGATPFRHRMSRDLRQALPPALLILGGLAGLAGTGLQGSGLTTVAFGMICAMTGQSIRPPVLLVVGLAWLGVGAVAIGYIFGILHPPYASLLPSHPLNWAGTTLVMFVLILFAASVLDAYQWEMQELARETDRQRDAVAELANHDGLTGLPTLRLARDRLDMACGQALRRHERVAVLYVELEGFKLVNDGFGLDAGDAVLRAAASRLLAAIRAVDTAARTGGAAFVVVLNGVATIEAAAGIAVRMVRSIAEPVGHDGLTVRVGARIGIALYPDHGTTGEALIRHAEQAMDRVRDATKTGYAVFDPA